MKIRPFVLPRPLAMISAAFPQTPPTVALCLALNALRDRLLPADCRNALEGKYLRVQVTDAGLTLDFTVRHGWFAPSPAVARADVTLAATAYDFLCLATREEDPDTLFFARRLVMQGDTDLGLLVKNSLDAAEWPAFRLADLAPHRVFQRLTRLLAPRSA
jgi:predicted lipid carrier protein YhbT